MKLIRIVADTQFGGEAEFELTKTESQKYIQVQDKIREAFSKSFIGLPNKEFHDQLIKSKEDIEIPDGKLLGAWPREVKYLEETNIYWGFFQFDKRIELIESKR